MDEIEYQVIDLTLNEYELELIIRSIGRFIDNDAKNREEKHNAIKLYRKLADIFNARPLL